MGFLFVIAAQQLRQSPIHHQHLTELADHDVLRLEVAMQHALAVGEGDGVADFAEDAEQAREWEVAESFGDFFAQIGEDGLQRAAFDELHRVEQRQAVLPHDVVDGHDVRMRELREHLGLAQKALPHAGVRIRFQQHHLDGHGAVQLPIPSLQHTAHAAAGDLRPELVVLHAERWWCWGVGGHDGG